MLSSISPVEQTDEKGPFFLLLFFINRSDVLVVKKFSLQLTLSWVIVVPELTPCLLLVMNLTDVVLVWP